MIDNEEYSKDINAFRSCQKLSFDVIRSELSTADLARS